MHHAVVPRARRAHERRHAVAPPARAVGAALDEHAYDLAVAGGGGEAERRVTRRRRRVLVHVDALGLDEDAHDGLVALLRRVAEQRERRLLVGRRRRRVDADVRLGAQERADGLRVAVRDGDRERRHPGGRLVRERVHVGAVAQQRLYDGQ
eukprot:1807098-Prymnesium_polylepis.2